jgi:hypothetical protein
MPASRNHRTSSSSSSSTPPPPLNRDLNGQSPTQIQQSQHATKSKSIMTQAQRQSSSSAAAALRGMGARPRRESRPITSIATTTAGPSSNATTSGSRQGHHHSTSPAQTRTEDTTFSLPIDIIDTPDLDELGLSPVGSASPTRPPSPLSSTPVSPPTPPPSTLLPLSFCV